MRMGGYLSDIPVPHTRCFPGDRPREVTIKLTSFIGYSPGAKHWYVDISEEDNYLWNSSADDWQIAWDDSEGKGFTERVEFAGKTARDRALKWIRKVVSTRYSNKTLWKINKDYMPAVNRPVPWEGD